MKKLIHPLPAGVGEKIQKAAQCYTRRRDRLEHPDGTFDNASRWYPDDSEGLDENRYRSPSRAWPYSYMLACRTVAHCAQLHGVPQEYLLEVRRAVRAIDAARATSALKSS